MKRALPDADWFPQVGASVTLKIVADAGHGEVTSPRIVGDLISAFVMETR
jgi:hypothetical protein